VILLIDHDDSFVFTLASYVEELGEEAKVVRAGEISAEAIATRLPTRIVLSPGPGTPDDWPVTIGIIHALGPSVPILGVCLGHQCVASAYGAKVERTPHPRHGRTSMIVHDGRGVFMDVPSPCRATRYHSLAVVALTLPPELEVSAVADDGDVMGIRHRTLPIEGVQFHPESVLTECGHQIIANFLGNRASLSFAPCA
jgi:anthranilate synthase/aminodeoxychorismate synthase-like glutamine amidotransferase